MRRKTQFILAAAALSSLVPAYQSVAQIVLSGTSYTENFDSLGTTTGTVHSPLPTGLTLAIGATSTSLGNSATMANGTLPWNNTAGTFGNYATGTYAQATLSSQGTGSNATTAMQAALTDRAVGIRQASAAGFDPGAAFEFSISNTSGFQGFSWDFDFETLFTNTRGATWTFDYRVGNSGAFTSLGTYTQPLVADTSAAGAFGVIQHEHFDMSGITSLNNQGLPVTLRAVALTGTSGSGSRGTSALDNFVLNFSAATGGNIDNSTIFWNPSLSASGPSDGSGTWDSSTPEFYNPISHTNVAFNDATPSNAVFGAGTGAGVPATVTLGNDHTAGALTFSASSNVYTINGGTITLVGSSGTASVSPATAVTAQQNATINSNVVLGGASGTFQTITASAGATLLMTGLVSGSGTFAKFGAGTLHLTNTANTFGHFELDAGTLILDVPSELGATSPTFISGTVQNTAPINFATTVNIGGVVTFDTTAGDVTFAGKLGGNGTLNKNGPNSIVMNAPAGVIFPGMGGTMNINGGFIKVQSSSGSTFFDTQLGSTTVNINNGAALELDNIQSGAPNVFGSVGTPVLNNGGKLIATGNVAFSNGDTASFGGDTANPAMKIGNAGSAVPSTVMILTSASSDTLNIQGPINQVTANNSGTFATVNVNGPGRIILSSGYGSTNTTSAFAGAWQVNGGILQLGPIRPNSLMDPTNGLAFNTSEPLNALGFYNNKFSSGSPVTINAGATLAIASDMANANNTATAAKQQATGGTVTVSIADYLQAPVTLNGGSVASSNFEVTQDRGNPTTTPVSAMIGGPFTVTSAGGVGLLAISPSRVLTYDPVAENGIGANSISLVAAGGTTFSGNLTVDPGMTTGGAFTINRDYTGITSGSAPISIAAGATITVLDGATLKLTGSAALSDGTHHVNIVNNSSNAGLDVEANAIGSSQLIGNLTGSGATVVGAGASLTVNKIAQNSLTVNGSALLRQNGSSTVVVNSLTIGDNSVVTPGKLDLNDNDMVLPYSGTSPIGTVRTLLRAGYNFNAGGTWDGTGIASLAAHSNADHTTGLAAVEASDLGINSIDGVDITGSAVIVKYTYNGDSNIDGVVDLGNDFNLYLQGFLGLGSGWVYGDYNYDNTTDTTDFGMYVDAFKLQGGALGDLEAVISDSTLLTVSQKAALLSATPEPTAAAVLLVAAMGAGMRRRKHR